MFMDIKVTCQIPKALMVDGSFSFPPVVPHHNFGMGAKDIFAVIPFEQHSSGYYIILFITQCTNIKSLVFYNAIV